MSYIIKIKGAGRLDGEYGGAATLEDSRARAAEFTPHVPPGTVSIVQPSEDGRRVYHVEDVPAR